MRLSCALLLFVLHTLALRAEPADGCSKFIDSLPSNFFRGWVRVPEDWKTPNGRKISVFYYGNIKEGLVPIVFFNGGPGSDSHDSYNLFSKKGLLAKTNFIFIDQRGTGCSDVYPRGTTQRTVNRLMSYGSRSIVKDAEIIRRKLLGEHGKWIVFGHSYGALIAQRYLSLYPKNLDGVVAAGYSVMSNPLAWLRYRILAQKNMGALYLGQFPEDFRLLMKIRRAIPNSRCFDINGLSVCGNAVMDSMVALLGSPSLWPALHSYIVALATYANDPGFSHGATLSDFVNTWVQFSAGGNPLASLAITQLEMSIDGTDSSHCQEIQAELLAAGDDTQLWPFNECRLLVALNNAKFVMLVSKTTERDPLRLDEINRGLSRLEGLKLNLFVAGYDIFDPPSSFQEERLFLGTKAETHFISTSDHDGLLDSPEVWDLLIKGAAISNYQFVTF